MSRLKCIFCDHDIDTEELEDIDIGEVVECNNCSAELEIAQTNPVKIKRPE